MGAVVVRAMYPAEGGGTPAVLVETTQTIQITEPRDVSQDTLQQQVDERLTAAGATEVNPFLQEGLRTTSAATVTQIVGGVLAALRNGAGATTAPIVYLAMASGSAAAMLGVVNVQVAPPMPNGSGQLVAHQAAQARIDNEIVRRLGPAIYQTYKDSSPARMAIIDALVRALAQGEHEFNDATNYGQSGDQDRVADAVIDTVVQSFAARLRR